MAGGFAILVATIVAAPALAYPAYAGVANTQINVSTDSVEYVTIASANIPKHGDSYTNS
jgi:hypothetical protein